MNLFNFRRTLVKHSPDSSLTTVETEKLLQEQRASQRQIAQLERENAALKQEVEKWKRLADGHLPKPASASATKVLAASSEAVVCTLNGVHFHRANCKWLENIPKDKLMRVNHEEAV